MLSICAIRMHPVGGSGKTPTSLKLASILAADGPEKTEDWARGVVANMADEVVVIFHGEIMERGPVEDIFRRPRHPYLKALLNASPHFDMEEGERLVALREARPRPPIPASARRRGCATATSPTSRRTPTA